MIKKFDDFRNCLKHTVRVFKRFYLKKLVKQYRFCFDTSKQYNRNYVLCESFFTMIALYGYVNVHNGQSIYRRNGSYKRQ